MSNCMINIGCNVWRQFLKIKGARHFFGVVLCADHEYHNEKILKNNAMCLIYPCSLTLKFPCLFIENGWNARKAVKKYFFSHFNSHIQFLHPKKLEKHHTWLWYCNPSLLKSLPMSRVFSYISQLTPHKNQHIGVHGTSMQICKQMFHCCF